MTKTYTITSFNNERFSTELTQVLRDKIIAKNYSGTTLTIHINPATPLTIPEEDSLINIVAAHTGQPIADLRVYRILPKDLNPKISDFSILGFRKNSPSYDRGRKTEAIYKCVDTEEVIVKKTFSDVRDINGILTGVQVKFDWYDENNVVSLTKTEVVREYNKYEAETEERKRRERQLDYLIAGAKDTPVETHVATIFAHYHDVQLKYKESGVSDFNDAIDAETNPSILGILAIVLPRVDDPTKTITVKQSIKYQLGEMTLSEIEIENGE